MIEGTAPYLSPTLTEEIGKGSFSLLGFTFGETEYYDTNLSSLYIDPHKYSPATLKAAITGKIIKSQLSATEALDDDGDGNFELSAKTPSSLSVAILNSSGGDISGNTSLFSDSLCSSSSSYKVKIKISGDLILTTEYGNPRNKDYSATKEYEVSIAAICNLKPAEMTIYTTGDLSILGGYNADKFDPTNGFKVKSGFPTTGFKGAVFSLLGSGTDQSKYRCSSANKGTKISLSGTSSANLGANCTVTYNSVTKGDFTLGGLPTITMEYSADGSTNWKQVDSFTIPTPTKWAIGMGVLQYGDTNDLATSMSFPALDACRTVGQNADNGETTTAQAINLTDGGKKWRQKYLYTRAELTNSPHANTSEGSSPAYSANYFSRDADGTFMGEWGNVQNYTESGWSSIRWYWTSEAWSTAIQFVVYIYGSVTNDHPNDSSGVICRGE